MTTELEKDYPRETGSGSGTETAYTVEARYNYTEPARIAGQIFDERWRRVNFRPSEVGVPRCPEYKRQTKDHGLLGYSAAQALRWWLHAIADSGDSKPFSGFCLETRLVLHRITYSHHIEAIAVRDHVDATVSVGRLASEEPRL
jgi:hypothetical protein